MTNNSFRKAILFTGVFFSVVFPVTTIFARNPIAFLSPTSNILDPGSPNTPWGGCGPLDANCYLAKKISNSVNNNQPPTGIINRASTQTVSAISNQSVLSALRNLLEGGLPADVVNKLRGPQGPKGDPGVTTIVNTTITTNSLPSVSLPGAYIAPNPATGYAGGSLFSATDLSSTNLITKDAKITTLAVSGNSTFTGNLDVSGTLSSVGSTTLATGTSTTNTFGSGASSANTIGSTTTPGTLTLHGATTLDNTFSQTGANTFSTGTGAVSLNGDTTIASTKTLTATTSSLGTATGTTFNGLTITANGTNTLNIAAGKSLIVSNSLTLAGTDTTTMTFPATSATIARTDAGQTFTGTQVFSSLITGSISGNAATVTTNANLTGPITSVGNATSVASQTGTGSTFVMNTSPTLVTPILGVASGTSLALGGATIGSNALAVTGSVSLDGAVTITGANTFATGTGTVTLNNVSTNISSSSPVIDLTTATTLSINTVTNRPVTFGTGNVTIPNLYVTNYEQNSGTSAISSTVATGTIFSVTDNAITNGTLIGNTLTANAGNGQVSYGQVITVTDATVAGGGYTGLAINVSGAGVGSGSKYVLDLNPGTNQRVVFDSTGAFRPTAAFASNTNTIGSPSYYWKNGYFDTVTANNLSGTVITGATSSTTWTIGSTQAGDVNEAVVFQRNSGSGNALVQWNAGAGDVRYLSTNYPFNATYTVDDTSIGTGINLISGNLTNNTTAGTQKLLSVTNTGTGTTENGIYIGNTGTGTTALEIAGTWTNGIVTNNNSINAGTGAISGGAITGTTINGNTITTGTGTLTLGAGKTLTVSDSTTLGTNSITLAGGEVITFSATNALSLLTTAGTSVTLPTTGTLATLAGIETFTNKTLTSPKINEDVALTTTATKLNYLTSAGGTTGTTSTNLVFSTSPVLVTPTLGDASATTINKVTITTPLTGSTLTIADGKVLTISKTMSLTAADDTGAYTLPTGTKTLVATDVATLSSLTSVGTITTGTWSGLFGAVSGANLTSLTAGNLSGTIPSAVLGNSTVYIGTTAIALNRASLAQSLTGITSIDGSAATLTTSRNIYGNAFNGSADITAIIASTYGGTGNGFTKFSGPTTSEKTFTLPDASGTLAIATGLSGGQTIYGGTGANDDLTLEGTSDVTKTSSYVILQPTSGNVVIGTTAPANSNAKLTMSTTGLTFVDAVSYGASGIAPVYRGLQAQGTAASPTATLSGDTIVLYGGTGYTGTTFRTTQGDMTLFAAENWSNTNMGTYLRFRTTPLGTTTPLEAMRIDSTGYVGINNISPGSALDVKGTLRLSGATSGYVGFTPAAVAGSATYTLPSADGTSGYALTTNGSGTLSWASSTPAKLVQNFTVAAGQSVTAGDVVSYINGNIKKGSNPGTTISGYGSAAVYDASEVTYNSAAVLDSTHFVVAAAQTSGSYGYAWIGTISGTTISYGSTYMFYNGASYPSVAVLDSTHFVVAFQIASNGYGAAVIGTVSGGNTISYGTVYNFNAAGTDPPHVSALSSSSFVVTYSDRANTYYGTAVVGTVSGTVITFGSTYVFNSANTYDSDVAALDSTHFVVIYSYASTSYYGKAVIGTVSSGTTVSYGTVDTFNAVQTTYMNVTVLSSSSFVAAYQDGSNTYGTSIVGTVSGTTISHGSVYVFNSGNTLYNDVAMLSSTSFVVTYTDVPAGWLNTAKIGTVSGTTISYGAASVVNGAQSTYLSVTALSSGSFVAAFSNYATPAHAGTAVVGTLTLTPNYLGIAQSAASAGQSVSVITNGISDVHSGLTAGSVYYSDTSGVLSTTPSSYRVGLAISTTAIQLSSNTTNTNQFFGDMIFANNFLITEGWDYPNSLIFKNQLGRSILSIDETGKLKADALNISGNVGIGTTSPAQKLDIVGATGDTAVVSISTAGGNTCTFSTTTGTFACASDERLKHDIAKIDTSSTTPPSAPLLNQGGGNSPPSGGGVPASSGGGGDSTNMSALSKLLELNPVMYHYNWQKENDPLIAGFIAQDFEKVFPDMVFTNPTTGFKSLSYAPLMPYVVKAIQELDLKINDMSAKEIGVPTTFGQQVSAFFSDVLTKVESGVAYMKGLVVNTLEIGTTEQPNGITMYDKTTKEPYCLEINNGEILKTKGKCIAVGNSSSSSSSGSSSNSSGDTIAPVITLNGEATINLAVGETYTEAGATATDNIDTEVAIIISGSVDTSTIGINTITYSAKDTAGNSATPITRTINVGDVSTLTPPTALNSPLEKSPKGEVDNSSTPANATPQEGNAETPAPTPIPEPTPEPAPAP